MAIARKYTFNGCNQIALKVRFLKKPLGTGFSPSQGREKVLFVLLFSGTTLNIMSLMGLVMLGSALTVDELESILNEQEKRWGSVKVQNFAS